MPKTKLILTGPLPTGLKKDEPRRKKYEKIQALLKAQNHEGAFYFPILEPFLLPNGDINLAKYGNDGIHLTEKGYNTWASALKPVIEKTLKK